MTQELVRRIPPELERAGVRIETDADGGYRTLTFPPETHDVYNVLLPESEIVRDDPSWTPNPRAVLLNPERHTYHDSNSRQGERSLNKLGLFALASVAGLGVPRTQRIAASTLGPGKIGWQATVLIRRSDGTQDPVTASKVVDEDVEREKVRQGVSKLNKADAEKRTIFERRWLYEREHMESKCETKAIERAIRAALQLPHSFKEEELRKPFLVVGYSFTPDPETARAIALSAQSALYGPTPALPEPSMGELPPVTAAEEGSEAAIPADPDPEAAPTPSTDFGGEEPTAPSTGGELRFPSGRHEGVLVADLWKAGGEGRNYVEWAAANAKTPEFKSALQAFVKAQA